MDSDSEQSDATTPPLSELSESPLVSVSDNETSEESAVSPSETADLSTTTVDDSNSSQDDDERASRNEVHYKPPKDGPVRRQHHHPFGPNRDSMGNYVGPGGDQESLPVKVKTKTDKVKTDKAKTDKPNTDKAKTDKHQDIEEISSQSSDGVSDETENLSGSQQGKYTIKVKSGKRVVDVLKRQAIKLKPCVIKGAKRLRWEKNMLMHRMRPHLEDVRSVGLKVSDSVKEKGTKLGIQLALRGVRYITGRQSGVDPADLTDDDDLDPQAPHVDPFDFDFRQLKVEPVAIPKLVVNNEYLASGREKTHAYFESRKDAMYNAVIDQAASKVTKDIVAKLKKKETKPKEKQVKQVRGHILIGLRYDEKHEQLTVFLERCHGLEKPGWLMMRGSLHINGFLVKEERAKIEQITSINPELKRRMVFSKVQRTLLDEYTVSVYLAFRKYFSYYKFFGQVNLSSKSKIKDEEAIWREAVKLPGEAAFKQLAIQPFVGLVKKPWTADEVEAEQSIGFLHVTLKTSNMGSGIIITCTFDKAEELRLPQGNVIFVEIFIVKDHICLAKESTLSKKVGQKVTAIEEQFDFPVEMEDVQQVELLAVVFQKTFSGKEALGQICLAAHHGRSTVKEMDVWQTVMNVTNRSVGKRLQLRQLIPEITYCSLLASDEIQVHFREPSLLPGKDQLGVLFFSLKYDENKEQLGLFIEMVNDFSLPGTYYIEGYLWDLKSNIRKRECSASVRADGFLIEFKETVRFKNLHSSFYESHHLCIQLVKKVVLASDKPVGQAVLKIEKPG